jgi:hypothetical protein
MSEEIVKYDVTDAAISDMKARYMALTVKGLDDRQGLAEVHEARMFVKGKRLEVEKKRKELKADALAWGQKVDAEARRITKLLEPIETHLTTEEEKITKEKERIKAEAERKAQETAQDRVNQFAQVGRPLPFAEALSLPDGEFSAMITIARAEYEAEQARIEAEKRIEAERAAAEKKAREEEAAKLAAERADLERIRAEQEAAQRVIEAAKRALELEQARKEAAERAIQEAKEAAQRAKEEAERQERMKPDKDRLIRYANQLIELPVPELVSDDAKSILAEARSRLPKIQNYIIKAAKEL